MLLSDRWVVGGHRRWRHAWVAGFSAARTITNHQRRPIHPFFLHDETMRISNRQKPASLLVQRIAALFPHRRQHHHVHLPTNASG